MPTRRTFLAQSLASAVLLALAPARALSATELVVSNIAALYPGTGRAIDMSPVHEG